SFHPSRPIWRSKSLGLPLCPVSSCRSHRLPDCARPTDPQCYRLPRGLARTSVGISARSWTSPVTSYFATCCGLDLRGTRMLFMTKVDMKPPSYGLPGSSWQSDRHDMRHFLDIASCIFSVGSQFHFT